MLRPSRFLIGLLLAIATLVMVVQNTWSQDLDRLAVAPFAPGLQSITEAQSRQILSFLAGPNTQGRSPIQPGFAVAAGYATSFLEEAGLKPILADGSYFQRIQLIGTQKPSFSLQTQDGSLEFSSLNGTLFAQSAPEKEVSGIPLFLSVKKGATQLPPGITPADFQDKILVYSMVDPVPDDAPELEALDPILDAGNKMIVTAGDLTSLIARTPRDPPWSLVFADASPIAFDADRPPIQTVFIDQENLSALITASGASPASTAANTIPIAIGTQELVFKFGNEQATRPIESMNVLAFIEGSDPRLKSEVVGIGAHLDHMGLYLDGSILNGADDNGSGDTALLNVARAMMVNPVKPKRSVLFLLFTGEEEGEIGSQYYVEHPVIPHQQMVAFLNMDTVGRNSEQPGITPAQASQLLYLESASCFPDLQSSIVQANRAVGLQLEIGETNCDSLKQGNAGSDHANFARVDIPVAFFFTGLHADYHQPGDTVDKINFEKLTNVSKLVYLTVQGLANQKSLNLRPS